MTTIPRLRLKNLKTHYALRPAKDPAYRQVIERVAKPAYDAILSQFDALLDAHEGDIPVEDVRHLCAKLYGESFHLPDVSLPDVPQRDRAKTPLGIEMVKLSMLYYAELKFGIGTALNMILYQYDPVEGADEQDLEEEMNELRRSVEGK